LPMPVKTMTLVLCRLNGLAEYVERLRMGKVEFTDTLTNIIL